VAVVSAGPYANQLHLTPVRSPYQHLVTQFFTDEMVFFTPNQQCQSTGKYLPVNTKSCMGYNVYLLQQNYNQATAFSYSTCRYQ